MRADAALWVDLYLSLTAVGGLLVLHRVSAARGPDDPLTRRFLFGLRVTLLLFAGRALEIAIGLSGVRVLVLLAASLIPLAVLILTEGLLRRHAPAWAKRLIGGGTALFISLAILPAGLADPARNWGLLVFQISGLLVSGGLILRRDKASLSGAENRAVERLGLSLIALIPLVAADYLMLWLGLPVQLSPLAVLFLCWLAISLGRTEAGHRGSLVGFGSLIVASACAAAVLTYGAGLDRAGAILTLAVILSTLTLSSILTDARTLTAEARSLSLLRHMAEFSGTDPVEFLRGLASHPLVEGASVIDAADLADLDLALLDRLFAAQPVLRRATGQQGGEAGDHIAHLCDRFAATHLLLARISPLQLVALAMPALSASPRAELELRAVQRMAGLMSQGDINARN